MIEYILVFLFSAFSAFLAEGVNKRNNFFYFLLFFILISLGVFRSELIGPDTNNYIFFVNEVVQSNSLNEAILVAKKFDIEIFFSSFVYFLGLFIGNGRLVFDLLFSLIFFNLIFFIKKIKIANFILIVSFLSYLNLYFQSLNILRQSIAFSFLLLSFLALVNKNNIRYFIFLTIASLFHFSALVGVLYYFFKTYSKMLSKYWYLLFLFCFAFLYKIDLFFSYFDKYSVYSVEDGVTSSPKIFFVFSCILFFISKMLSKRILIHKELFDFLICIFLVSISIQLYQITSVNLNQGVSRLNIYFFWSSSLIIYIILTNIFNKRDKIISYFIFFGIMLCYFIYLIGGLGPYYMPFIFIS